MSEGPWAPAGSEGSEGSEPAPAVSDLLSTSCHACGSRIRFVAGTTVLRCEACRTERPVEIADEARITEHSFRGWLQQHAGPPVADIAGVVVQCQGCGAESESRDIAHACTFCGGHLVVLDHPAGLVAPEAVVPFGLSDEQARTAFRGWVSSRWLAPSDLKKVGATEGLTGTYVPYWTFDAHTTTDYRGRRGDYYYVTRTRSVSDGRGGTRTETYQERRTRWRNASGRVMRFFDDVLTLGSRRIEATKLEKMGPWRLEQAAPYAPGFLAGYDALRYDIDPQDAAKAARSKMETVIAEDVRRDIGGDEQRITSMDVHFRDVMFKLVLLPLFIATYVYGGQRWQVLVNANTGEVVGDRPWSKVKIAALVLLAIAAVVGIVIAVQSSR